MSKRLLVIDGADQGRSFLLPEVGTVLIGNYKNHRDICLNDFYVAQLHCQVQIDSGKYTLCDQHTAAGTLVNGQKITQYELQLGDVIRVGNSYLRLEEYNAIPNEEQPGVDSPTPLPTILPGPIQREIPKLPHISGDELEELTGHDLSHYSIREVIARGHSGVTFLARDKKISLMLALKVLSPDFPANEAEMQRLVGCLKPRLAMAHKGLVTLRGVGKTGPYVWLATDRMEGPSVAKIIELSQKMKKSKWQVALRVGIQIGRALDFIHQHHQVHGNITPANILTTEPDGPARLNDLGLWIGLSGSELWQESLDHKMAAELPYWSPEHVHPDLEVDDLSDQYSLGAVMYALLTGRPPAEGKTPEQVIAHILNTMPPRPRELQKSIPDMLQAVVLKMLSKHPEDRYPAPGLFLEDLERIADEQNEAVD